MRVLSVVHGSDARTELFRPVVEEAGHRLDEWSFVWDSAPPPPVGSYDAVFVFGGAMHADQDSLHPWLADETAWLAEVVARRTPVLGVCLGVQLLARALDSWVERMVLGPEVGWCPVTLTDDGADDPVLGVLPREFTALQWHHYTYGLPAGAVELARSPVCTQAFRVGETCWGVQFHPEVTASQLEGWLDDPDDPAPEPAVLRAETPLHIERWNELGRALCRAFLDAAEHVLARAA
jgi:GMP synthase (glutamine-hydrolysing)